MSNDADRSAEKYVHGHHATVLESHGRRTAANSCAYLLPHLSAGTSLLDVGFGPGSITADLAEIVAPGRLVGVESAPTALTAAQQVVDARGLGNVDLQVGDVYALDFADDSFDVVHCHQVLQHLSDPAAALREMTRVASRVVAAREADYGAMHWWPDNAGMDAWLDAYRTTARGVGGEPDAGRRLRAWALAAGIDPARTTVTSTNWTYADAATVTWWGNSQADRVLHSDFRERLLEHGYARADLEAMAAGWRKWAAQPDAVFTMVHTELLVLL